VAYLILICIILALLGITIWLGSGKSVREQVFADARKSVNDMQSELSRTQKSYVDFREKFAPLIGDQERQEKLKAEIGILEQQIAQFSQTKEKFEMVELGVYRREFTYEDPASYQDALEKVWKQQEIMLKEKKAAICSIPWEVKGSQKEGAEMVGNLIKLALRAFNGEADACIARVKWNNKQANEEKIRKAEDAVEKMLKKWGITIADSYRNLKLKELSLTFEKAELDKKIQDEQKQIREMQREEERAIREAEQARRKAEQEESKIEDALAKAKEEMSKAHTQDMTQHVEKIRELEIKLAEAEEKRQRAISQAELTRLGHIYITSNIGSFGDTVFKIGMTRRLDPMDRIWELSDASVPFDFDVHGMIRTEDAPALEAKLHEIFSDRRLNLVNRRREFFRVTLSEIQAVCDKEGFDIRLTLAAEAREWYESEAMRKNLPAAKGPEMRLKGEKS
jgi:hypothetical protein